MKEHEIGPDLRLWALWEVVPLVTAAPQPPHWEGLMKAKPTLGRFSNILAFQQPLGKRGSYPGKRMLVTKRLQFHKLSGKLLPIADLLVLYTCHIQKHQGGREAECEEMESDFSLSVPALHQVNLGWC